MAQKSLFWTTTGAVGDGATPYTQTDWMNFLKRMFITDTTKQGVVKGYANELAVSGAASPLTIATGAAMVYGFPYENDAATTLAVSTPAIGTTGHRVVLRVNWAAQTVRVALVSSADGVAAIPALTQTALTTWEISLATLTITTGGAITVTDARNYCKFATQIPASVLSGTWGASPLTLYGSDDGDGLPIYTDTAGQLRAEPATTWIRGDMGGNTIPALTVKFLAPQQSDFKATELEARFMAAHRFSRVKLSVTLTGSQPASANPLCFGLMLNGVEQFTVSFTSGLLQITSPSAAGTYTGGIVALPTTVRAGDILAVSSLNGASATSATISVWELILYQD